MMKDDNRSFRLIDAFYIFWIVGCSSVLLDMDHIWKILGLEEPANITYFPGRAIHTPLVFILFGSICAFIITAHALGQMDVRWRMDLSRKRAARYISSFRKFVRWVDNICGISRFDIVLVSGSGGHLKRALILRNYFKEALIIIPFESEFSKHRVKENYVSVISPRFRAKSNKIMTILRTLLLFVHSIMLIVQARPKMIISTGSGLSLPIMLVARFFHVKTVYIESPSRVFKPSITGEFFINKTDEWLALWRELAKRYGVKYGGMLA